MREAAEPQPCPLCDAEGRRIISSAFTAFVMRQGYPRRIPDRGTYWHLGQEVSYLPGRARPYEHPEVKNADAEEPLSSQEREAVLDRRQQERRAKRAESRRRREAVRETKAKRKRN